MHSTPQGGQSSQTCDSQSQEGHGHAVIPTGTTYRYEGLLQRQSVAGCEVDETKRAPLFRLLSDLLVTPFLLDHFPAL